MAWLLTNVTTFSKSFLNSDGDSHKSSSDSRLNGDSNNDSDDENGESSGLLASSASSASSLLSSSSSSAVNVNADSSSSSSPIQSTSTLTFPFHSPSSSSSIFQSLISNGASPLKALAAGVQSTLLLSDPEDSVHNSKNTSSSTSFISESFGASFSSLKTNVMSAVKTAQQKIAANNTSNSSPMNGSSSSGIDVSSSTTINIGGRFANSLGKKDRAKAVNAAEFKSLLNGGDQDEDDHDNEPSKTEMNHSTPKLSKNFFMPDDDDDNDQSKAKAKPPKMNGNGKPRHNSRSPSPSSGLASSSFSSSSSAASSSSIRRSPSPSAPTSLLKPAAPLPKPIALDLLGESSLRLQINKKEPSQKALRNGRSQLLPPRHPNSSPHSSAPTPHGERLIANATQMQEQVFASQETILDDMRASLARLSVIGGDIHSELGVQKVLIEEQEEQMDANIDAIQRMQNKIQKVLNRTTTRTHWYIIFGLIGAILFLLFLIMFG